MTEPDEVMQRIGEGIAAGQRGDRVLARSILGHVWHRIGGDDGDALHRVAVAHSMADVQDDIADELAWDVRAMHAADALADERIQEAGVAGTAATFRPSLHLNLADVHRRLGDTDRALEHVRLGTEALDTLPHDGYRTMVRDALARVAQQVTSSTAAAADQTDAIE